MMTANIYEKNITGESAVMCVHQPLPALALSHASSQEVMLETVCNNDLNLSTFFFQMIKEF